MGSSEAIIWDACRGQGGGVTREFGALIRKKKEEEKEKKQRLQICFFQQAVQQGRPLVYCSSLALL